MRTTSKPFSESLYLALLVTLGLPLGVACGGAVSGENAGTGGTASTGGTSGSGSAPSTGGTTGVGGSVVSGTACSNPTTNPLTGLVDCDEGYSHRPSEPSCSSNVPRSTPIGPSGNPSADQCLTDGDCGGGNAFCKRYGGGFSGAEYNACVTGCTTDAECGENQYCLCGDPVGTCVFSTCHTDADCDEGFFCVGTETSSGSGCGTTFEAGCQRASDECLTDSECADSGLEGCRVTEAGRVCQSLGACGRPFLVGGKARRAETVRADGWVHSLRLEFDSNLSLEERAALGRYYAECALLEHASVAAFARHALELLALGAPPELLDETTNAMRDETRHAKLCFSIASELLGENLGPSGLPIGDALGGTTLDRVLETTLLEGVVGETRAALELRVGAARTTNAPLREIALEIAEDESRHAALAFRFVRFALEREPSLVSFARKILEEARATLVREIPDDSRLPQGLLASGMLDASERRLIGLDAFDSVILPCFEKIAANPNETDGGLQSTWTSPSPPFPPSPVERS